MKKAILSTKVIWAYPLFTIICLAMSLLVTYSQKIADFSGEWTFNRSQSDSPLSQVAASTIIISQNGFSITLDITISPDDNQKPIKRTEKYVLNTSVANKVTKLEDKSRQVDTKLSTDGQSFTIAETILFSKEGVLTKLQRIDTYSISKDGKTLSIETNDILPENSTTPKDKRHETRLYNKII